MKPIALSLSLVVAASLSTPVFSQTLTPNDAGRNVPGQAGQTTAPDGDPSQVAKSWWQGTDYAKPTDPAAPTTQPTPPTGPDVQAPDWLSDPNFGWQAAPKTMEPAQDLTVFHVSDMSWGVQARNALVNESNPAWLASINEAEQRLVQRLTKARAAGEPYLVWVNLPAYRLRVLDTRDGGVLMESRVIIGKPGKSTPRMDTRIVNLKFNPDWSPPKSAVGKTYTPPGPRNPLGRVRFSTDNGIGIYLHDTNNHELFNTPVRAYSLGCVRVEAWQDLVILLSGQDEAWIAQQTRDWKIRWVDVPDVPVFIDYQRVDFSDDGTLTELADIYRLGTRTR